MSKRILFTFSALLLAAGIASTQQVPDLEYKPPRYESGQRPRCGIWRGGNVQRATGSRLALVVADQA